MDRFLIVHKSVYEEARVSVFKKATCQLKYIKGLDKQIPKLDFPGDCGVCFIFFSSVNLDGTELKVLSLKPKFCDRLRPVDQLKTDVYFENLFTWTKELMLSAEVEYEGFKATLVGRCNQFKNNKRHTKRMLTDEHREAIW